MAVDKAKELLSSPLTRLNEKAYEPKLCSHRVGYVEGTNKGGDLTDMTELQLFAMARLFPWPKGVTLGLPRAGGRSQAKYQGCIVIYEEALKAGFRLPLHPLIRKFLNDINLCPSQLSPNSWRCIIAFLLKCKELGLVPPYGHGPYNALKIICGAIQPIECYSGFYDIYFPNVNLITNPPSNDTSWSNKWFLVSESEEFRFNFRMYPSNLRKIVDFACDPEILKFMATLNRLPHPGPDYNEVLDPSRLEEAGLSLPHPITGECNEHISNRKREVECASVEPQQMDRPSKKAKTCISQPGEVEIDDEPHVIAVDDDKVPEEYVVRDSKGTRVIDALCNPEFITAVQRLPAILKAANHSEELQRQLDESRQEIVELKREKAELISKLDVQQCEELRYQLTVSKQENAEVRRRQMQLTDILAGKEKEFQLRIESISNRAMQDSDKLQWQLNESRLEIVEFKRREMKLVEELARKEREFEDRLKSMEHEKIIVEEELKETQANLKQLIRERSC